MPRCDATAEQVVERLYGLGRLVSRAESLEAVYRAALEGLAQLVGAQRASVLLFDEGQKMRFVAWEGLSEAYRRRVDGHSPWSAATRDPAPVVIPDVASDATLSDELRAAILDERVGALLFVPLHYRGELLGKLMAYFDAPGGLSEHEIRTATLVADYVGYAISRLRKEQELRSARDELAVVLDAVDESITVMHPDGTLRYANRQGIRHLDAPPADLVGRSTRELLGPIVLLDEAGRAIAPEDMPSRRAFAGEAAERVMRVVAPGGGEHWSHLRSRPIRSASGEVAFAVNISRDITAERRAAQRRQFLADASALLASSLDYGTTVARLAELVVPEVADWCDVRLLEGELLTTLVARHVDPERTGIGAGVRSPIVEGSISAEVLRSGKPRLVAPVAGGSLEALLHPARRQLAADLGLTSVLLVALRAHGQIIGLWSMGQAGSGRGFTEEDLAFAGELAERAAVAIDHARLYREAERSRERLEQAIEGSMMGSWAYDVPAGRVAWSEALAAIHGIPLDAFDGTFEGYLRDIHPDDRGRVMATLDAELERGDTHEVRYRILRPDGQVRWLEGRGRILRDAEGVAVSLTGTCVDITLKRLAEEAVANERERLEVTLNSIADAVVATDEDGRVTRLNETAARLMGVGREEAVGRLLSEVWIARRAPAGDPVDSPVAQVQRTGGIVTLPNGILLESGAGGSRAIESTAAPIRSADGRDLGVVLVFRDVTDRHRLEDELARAARLESVGLLAGGIAHDFNNLLTIILGSLSLIEASTDGSERVRQRLAAALTACARAQDLTRQLLTFARGGAPIKAPTSLAGLLRETGPFALHGSNCELAFELQPDLWPVDIDAGQISQVVHNLVLNAAQAMPDGGRVILRADNVPPADRSRPEGRRVRFVVEDSGRGIDAADLSKVFDPFFTTRPKGTGLGLATAHSIVRRHDGHIAIESAPGRGTRVIVHLPAAEASAAAPPREAAPEPHGRVLVMDDDPMLRELASECLRALGYEAVCTASGEQAILAYDRAVAEGRPFDVALMDLTVPGGMGGREAIARLRARYPDIRAIVSSGYSNDPVMSQPAEHGFVGVLRKPWSLRALRAVLQEAHGRSS